MLKCLFVKKNILLFPCSLDWAAFPNAQVVSHHQKSSYTIIYYKVFEDMTLLSLIQ